MPRRISPMKDEKGYLTDDQVVALIEASKKFGSRDLMLIVTLLHTGRRISEIVKGRNGYGIKPIDVDFESGNITYNLLKKNPRRRSAIEQGIPRPPPERLTLPADSVLLDMLKKYIYIHHIKDTDFFFPITQQRAGQIIKKIAKAANIGLIGDRQLHPHIFRHTYAVGITRIGKVTIEDLIQLKDMLGHSDISTTLTYLRYGNTRMRELIEKHGKKWIDTQES